MIQYIGGGSTPTGKLQDIVFDAKKNGDYAKEQGDAAKEAATNVSVAVQSANQAAENANAAANSANDKANLADEKATLAQEKVDSLSTLETQINQAITDSQTATENANASATNANDKATYAQQQGEYAKAQGDYAKQQGDTASSTIANVNNAITNAEQATANANNAAENANTAATNAQNVTDNIRYIEPYNPSTTYQKNNIVTYNGSSFIAKQTTTGNTPIGDANDAYWGLLAQKGTDGKGSVSSVNNLSPDTNGNVTITPNDIGAIPISQKGVPNGVASLNADGKVVNADGSLPGGVQSVNNKTGAVTLSAADVGAETPTGAQEKADAALNEAKAYTDTAPEVMQRNLGQFLTYRSGKNSKGVFTTVDYKRPDGTLFARSVLSNPDTNGNYQTRIITYYATDGTTVVRTDTWTLTYDADGDLVSEVKS